MDIWEVWERGVPLRDAALYCGNLRQVQELRKLRKLNNGMMMLERLIVNIEKGAAGKDIFKDVAGERTPAFDIERGLRNEILGLLEAGRLIAYGFSIPRKLDDAPQKLPSDLWSERVKWEQDRLICGNLEIEKIRVVDPAASIKLGEPAPKGRPSRREQILNSFYELDAQGKIDYTKPMARVFPLIQNMIKLSDPTALENDMGLGEKAISKIISSEFRAKKENGEKL